MNTTATNLQVTRTGVTSRSSNCDQFKPITSELFALERQKKKCCLHLYVYQIFIKLAGNEDKDKISDELVIWLSLTILFGINRLRLPKKRFH